MDQRGPPGQPVELERLDCAARRTLLAELRVELTRLVGPTTAALAAHAERARLAPDAAAPAAHPRIRIARALASDLGRMRALALLAAPATTRRARNRRPPTAARGPRGPQAGQAGNATTIRPDR